MFSGRSYTASIYYGAPRARSSAWLRIICIGSAMDRSSWLPETLPVVLV